MAVLLSLRYRGKQYSRLLLSLHNALGEWNPKVDLHKVDKAPKHVCVPLFEHLLPTYSQNTASLLAST